MEIETEYKLNLPKELVDLYTNHGPFSIYGEYGFKVFQPGLEHSFKNQFSNYQFYKLFAKETDALSDEQYEEIKQRFFFWGIGFYDMDGGSAMMYFYDRTNGQFGDIPLLSDYYDEMKDLHFPNLLNGKYSIYSLDELIGRQVNRVLLNNILASEREYQLLPHPDLDDEDKALFDGNLLQIYPYSLR